MKWTIMRLFRKARHLAFPPEYPPIAPADIPPGSSLLFLRANGNKWTQAVGRKLYRVQYEPDFHAALVVDDGRIINVGKIPTIKRYKDLLDSTTRIDVILYPEMTPEQRMRVVEEAYDMIGMPYDVGGYASFVTRFVVPLKWLVKPSDKLVFCSELNALAHRRAGHVISNQPASRTAPWDLREWAMHYTSLAEIRTLHVGKDFGK